VCCPGGPETSVVALDKRTGETVWKSPPTGDKAGYASPILIELEGLRMIVTLTSKSMIGVRAEDGKLLWRVRHQTLFDENILQPIYHDGHLFVSSLAAGSKKWQIEIRDGEVKVDEVWHSSPSTRAARGGQLLTVAALPDRRL
jgi:outer membrane protein assembly factor BamB